MNENSATVQTVHSSCRQCIEVCSMPEEAVCPGFAKSIIGSPFKLQLSSADCNPPGFLRLWTPVQIRKIYIAEWNDLYIYIYTFAR